MKQFYPFLIALCLCSLVGCKSFKPNKNDGAIGARKEQKRSLEKAGDKADVLDKRLRLAEHQVVMMEKDFRNYIKEFPNSALATYDSVIIKLKQNYQELEKKLQELRQQYKNLQQKWKDGFVVNTQKLNTQVLTMNGLVDDYITKVKANYGDYLKEKNSTVDIHLPADIFFGPGEFRVNYYDKKKRVEKYLQKVRQLRNRERFKNLRDDQLYLKVIAIGYTDGHPIHQSRAKISQACGLPFNTSHQELNQCLSKLRAKAVARFVLAKFSGYRVTKYVDGKGDEEAKGDTSDNPKLRKVDVSFRLSKIPFAKLPKN
ncbi:MAG TPA: hypothetical protein DCS93_24700 [Microscillaceae bacterium]|nr:hypothetical protein [Microscillaceae bacterium]